MKTLVWMLVMLVFLCSKTKSQTNFPDTSVLDFVIPLLDTKPKNNKISPDELAEYFAGGKAGSVEILSKFIKMVDQDGDNEASKDELLKMAKKIIEFYINTFDLDHDGALSEGEFVGKSLDVDGAIKDAQALGQTLLDLLDENKDGFFSSSDDTGSITFEQDDEQAKKYERIRKLFKRALDKNNDDKISKEEVKEFANTAIKLMDINKDGKITDEECYQTMEQHNISKKTVDIFRDQSQNEDIIKAWKDIFHKIDAKNKKDKKLYAKEVVQLLNIPIPELLQIGEKMGPILMSLFQKSPITSDEIFGAMVSFLNNEEFKQISIENTNKEPQPMNSSAIKKVNVMLVFALATKFGAIL